MACMTGMNPPKYEDLPAVGINFNSTAARQKDDFDTWTVQGKTAAYCAYCGGPSPTPGMDCEPTNSMISPTGLCAYRTG